MPPWVRLIRADDCPPNAGRYVEREGRELAVFRLSDPDRFIVTNNSCPHAGGNLAAGEVRDGCVTCPWHHWEFDLASGRCTLSEHAVLQTYPSRVREGYVEAAFPPPGPHQITESS